MICLLLQTDWGAQSSLFWTLDGDWTELGVWTREGFCLLEVRVFERIFERLRGVMRVYGHVSQWVMVLDRCVCVCVGVETWCIFCVFERGRGGGGFIG